MIALSVENLEFFKKFSSGSQDIHDSVFKGSRMAVSSDHKTCLMELSDFLAAFFFNAKIGKYQWQNLKQSISPKRPYDHWALSFFFWRSKNTRSPKTLNKPRKDWEFRISDLKGDNPRFGSSCALRLPVLDAKASFSIDEPCNIGKIGLRWNFALSDIFQGFKKFFSHSIIHMDFLFDFFNKSISKFKCFMRQWISSKCDRIVDVFKKKKADVCRFFFENEMIDNIFENPNKLNTTGSSPDPRWFTIFSFFSAFAKSATKFMKKIFAYWLKSGRNFQMTGKNFDINLLNVFFCEDGSISIYVTSKVCKIHEHDFTDKRIINQYPQRLTGWGLRNETCYSLNSWETMRGEVEVPLPPQLNKHNLINCGHKSNRKIIDAQMAFFGTGCIINEQVILQDQEGVLAWVSERLAA